MIDYYYKRIEKTFEEHLQNIRDINPTHIWFVNGIQLELGHNEKENKYTLWYYPGTGGYDSYLLTFDQYLKFNTLFCNICEVLKEFSY